MSNRKSFKPTYTFLNFIILMEYTSFTYCEKNTSMQKYLLNVLGDLYIYIYVCVCGTAEASGHWWGADRSFSRYRSGLP